MYNPQQGVAHVHTYLYFSILVITQASTVLESPATRQSIAWLGSFGLACTAVSDLRVTSDNNFILVTHSRLDTAVQASPNGPSQAIDCLVAGGSRTVQAGIFIDK